MSIESINILSQSPDSAASMSLSHSSVEDTVRRMMIWEKSHVTLSVSDSTKDASVAYITNEIHAKISACFHFPEILSVTGTQKKMKNKWTARTGISVENIKNDPRAFLRFLSEGFSCFPPDILEDITEDAEEWAQHIEHTYDCLLLQQQLQKTTTTRDEKLSRIRGQSAEFLFGSSVRRLLEMPLHRSLGLKVHTPAEGNRLFLSPEYSLRWTGEYPFSSFLEASKNKGIPVTEFDLTIDSPENTFLFDVTLSENALDQKEKGISLLKDIRAENDSVHRDRTAPRKNIHLVHVLVTRDETSMQYDKDTDTFTMCIPLLEHALYIDRKTQSQVLIF